MLVLSRKIDEKVIITVPPSKEVQKIVIDLVDIRGDKARIGFSADKTVAIHRHEIQEAIERSNHPGNTSVPYKQPKGQQLDGPKG